MPRWRDRYGFTVVELTTVVAILGILVTIAMPLYRVARSNADRAVLQENAHFVETKVRLLVQDGYDLTYRTGRADPDVFLSRRLAIDLAAGDIATADTVTEPIRNRVSGYNDVILLSSVNTNMFETPPAVFITRSNTYLYDRIRANPERLAGTIVVHFNRNNESLDVFWMDRNGVKSDEIARIPVEDVP